jgi:hypothetical protein
VTKDISCPVALDNRWSNSWVIALIFAVAGPLWALLAYSLPGLMTLVTGGFEVFIMVVLVAYVFEGIPSLLIGIAAAVSFQVRGRVALEDVLIASLVTGLGHLAVNDLLEPELLGIPEGWFVVFSIAAGLGGWLLVRKARKPIIL